MQTNVLASSVVPQGSVLWPVFFWSYINCFADKCIILRDINHRCDHNHVQRTVSEIEEGWCKDWDMIFNCDKTVLLKIAQKNNLSLFQWKLWNKGLQKTNMLAWLSNDLTWSLHISETCAVALGQLCFLRGDAGLKGHLLNRHVNLNEIGQAAFFVNRTCSKFDYHSTIIKKSYAASIEQMCGLP